MQGAAGTTVTLRHAEVLDKAGDFYTANSSAARETVRHARWRETTNAFTFQGWHVSVTAISENPGKSTGIVIHWTCQDKRVQTSSEPSTNFSQHYLGTKGNFLDVPTTARSAMSAWAGPAMRKSFAHRSLQHGRRAY